MSKTVPEMIAALEAKRAAHEARMEEILTKTAEEGRSTEEAEREEFDELQREVETIDGDLQRYRKMEKTMLARAVPAKAKTSEDATAARSGSDGHAGYVRVSAPQLPPGIRFARMVKCLGVAQGNRFEASQIARQQYGDDPLVAVLEKSARFGELSDMVTKAAVPAMSTIEANSLGSLVSAESGVFADFVEFLRPMTILGQFGAGGIPSMTRVPFRTALITQTSGGAAYWVGEGDAKGLTSFDATRTTLTPLKAANIAVITEELLRDSSPSADTFVRNALAAALRERLDRDFIDPAFAGSAGVSPASITNGVTQTMSSGAGGAGTGTAVQIRSDIRALVGVFLAAENSLDNGVWIMRPQTVLNLSLLVNALGEQDELVRGLTMRGGTLLGMPVIVSNYVAPSGSPIGDFVVLVNASDIWFADEGGINVAMSREASLQMDSVPTMAAGGGVASPAEMPTATSVVSMFQTNCVAFRCERTLNWARRRATAVAVLTGGNWGE